MAMAKSQSDIFKALAWPTYFVAFLMVMTPALDYVTNVWPVRIGDVGWRYGSAGLLAGFMLTPLFGLLFALGASVVLGHRVVMRALSVVNVVLAIALLVAVVFFALDVLQVRATVQEEALPMFDTGAIKATTKYLTMALALGWLGLVGLRVTKRSAKWQRDTGDSGKVPLVRAEGTPEAQP
jgi:hypothetical protein